MSLAWACDLDINDIATSERDAAASETLPSVGALPDAATASRRSMMDSGNDSMQGTRDDGDDERADDGRTTPTNTSRMDAGNDDQWVDHDMDARVPRSDERDSPPWNGDVDMRVDADTYLDADVRVDAHASMASMDGGGLDPSTSDADAGEECDGGACCTGDGGCPTDALCAESDDPRCAMASGTVMAGGVLSDAMITFSHGDQRFIASTDSSGVYRLRLPVETELITLYEHPALYSLLSYVYLPRGVPLALDVNMWWQQLLDDPASVHGASQAPEKGVVWVLRLSSATPGGEGIILDRPGDPPVVGQPAGNWAPGDTMNSESQAHQLFTNVEPGRLHPTVVSPEGIQCKFYPFVGPPHPEDFDYEVRAGTVTFLVMQCQSAGP